ncbi:CALX protein, partial [Prunella fulvescens]|nr:CALX protein [Prunella fulvescens]
MELKWLLCVTLLALGILAVQAHDTDEDNDADDVVDIEDDLDDGIEDVEESKSETSSAPPAPKVTYRAPVPTGEVYFAESFDKGTLDGISLSSSNKGEVRPLHVAFLLSSGNVRMVRCYFWFGLLVLVFFFQEQVVFQNNGVRYCVVLQDQFHDKTPYTIMFGPDKCGEDYKLHFIFRHKNPKTGKYEEKHAKRPDADLKTYFTDKKTHLYTLVLNPDNSFEILVDQTVVNSGNLLNDMSPPVNPPREIEDPNDQKPEDWDERPKIPDPDAVKPDDWDEDAPAKIADENAVKPEGWLDDEPEYVADPDAEKPEDWDEDMDGEWEAPQIANPKCETAPGCGTWQRPMIDNPNYKGKWKPPMIDNVNYQGIWKPRKIPNPDFFEDLEPFKMTPVSAVGLELWSMTSDIFFDNFIICSERAVADDWASDGWGLKKAADGAAEPGVVGQMMAAAEERPWLWVVYILTVALPVFLVILFCCSGKKQPSAAEYKKTDAPQPDVVDDEKEEEKDKGEKEEEEEEEDTNEEKLGSDADLGSASQEEEEDEEEEDRKPASEEEETVNRSPRNRKPRKD